MPTIELLLELVVEQSDSCHDASDKGNGAESAQNGASVYADLVLSCKVGMPTLDLDLNRR